MYTAMFLLAFHALLRVGEFTVRGHRLGHVIRNRDVKFEWKNEILTKMTVKLRHFKYSKRPVTLSISATPDSPLCPVTKMAQYMQIRDPSPGPVFINQDTSQVSSSQFTVFLRLAILDIGLNPKLYKPHSFRIGGANLAHQANFSETQLKILGRWSSSSYLRYIRVLIIPTL